MVRGLTTKRRDMASGKRSEGPQLQNDEWKWPPGGGPQSQRALFPGSSLRIPQLQHENKLRGDRGGPRQVCNFRAVCGAMCDVWCGGVVCAVW